MTRDELAQKVAKQCDAIKEKFALKNTAYGAPIDGYFNFRETARRMFPQAYGEDEFGAMFRIIEILKDKHNIALTNGIDVYECRDRLIDICVYCMIQVAMYDEKNTVKERMIYYDELDYKSGIATDDSGHTEGTSIFRP